MKYTQEESSVLEFKKQLPTKQQVVKTIIGFCNMYGGRLIIGVENNGLIVGVNEDQIDQLIEELHRSIFASCTPPIIPSLSTQRIDDKILLVIEVSEGMVKPYFISSVGKQEGTFIRIGTETVKASSQMIQELEWQSLGKYPDEIPLYSATPDEIDRVAFENFLKMRKVQSSESNLDELLRHYRILTQEHTRTYPTRGGILLFAKEPQKYLAESFIICTHFLGTTGREVVATRDCMGGLMQQYKDCISFLLGQLNKQFTIEGMGERREVLEIPEEALREVIINALVHRNYLIPGPTKVAIYDDRIEIFSPGNFPGPLRVNQLSMGVTYIRNGVITRVFREIGLMEKLGSGFLTLFETYANRGLPAPIVIEGTGFVKCILPRPGTALPSKNRGSALMQLFYKKSEVRILDVMHLLNISRATAHRLLKELLDEGLVKREGSGPSIRYLKAGR